MKQRPFLRVGLTALLCVLASASMATEYRMDMREHDPNASDSETQPLSLTLSEALDKAAQNNNSLRRARAEVVAREGKLDHARRWFPSNPSVSVSQGDREFNDGTVEQDSAIRLTQEIRIGGQRGLGKNAAQARVSAAEKRLAFLESSVRARTRKAWLRMLVERKAVDTAKRALELTDQLHGFAQKQLEAGAGSKLMLNTARIGKGRARAQLARARRDYEKARLALSEVLAENPERVIQLEGELEIGQVKLPEMDPLLRDALNRREDLAAAAREVVAAREELALSKRELIPNLRVFAFQKEEGDRADISGLGVEMPIPVWHWRGGENQQARARLKQAQIARDEMRLRVRKQVLSAMTDYEAARARLKAYGQSVLASAEENMKLTEEAFRAGGVGAPALTTAQDNLMNTRRDYLDALREAVRAATALERATGGLVALRAGGEMNNAGEQKQ